VYIKEGEGHEMAKGKVISHRKMKSGDRHNLSNLTISRLYPLKSCVGNQLTQLSPTLTFPKKK